MIIEKLIQAASIGVTVFIMAASASAGTITYTTNTTTPTPTAFVAGNICTSGCPVSEPDDLTLDSTAGDPAQLLFTPNASSISGTPSNINFGNFLLSCPTCGTSQSTTFGAFTFDLVITDTSDNATGEFVGTSSGGTVSSNSSTIDIVWSTVPVNSLGLGPGTFNALSGSFNSTIFIISTPTQIVAINSGSDQGETTVQGTVSSSPEPATLSLMGGALLGLGVFRLRRSFRS